MKIINRQLYLDRIKGYKDTNGIIKIITGIRRCGKSTLFKIYQNYLLENGVNQDQIISINLDDIENSKLLDYQVLYEYIKSRLINDKMNYVFLDEIQNVEKFQLVLNTLNLRENVDLYVTGSNAYLLSGELATFLSGRYITIKMYPLSFKEYVSSLKDTNNTNVEDKFANYITYGAFPYILTCNNNNQIFDYLEGIYNTIIIKDVIQRNNITDVERLKKILMFLVANIGSLTSINNIKNQMLNDNFKINVATIENYITYLTDSFIIHKVPRYNIKAKGLLQTNDKYYIADMGFRYYLLNSSKKDRGHILENIVYLELLRRNYRVYIGKLDNLEIDFIAEKEGERVYIQVCETMMGEETRERELKPLKLIKDNYEKIVLSMDKIFLENIDGIKSINLIDWLLK